MWEHMSNWAALLQRVRGWLHDDGRLFLHVFSHGTRPYAFDHADKADWIAQHFFTGGIMPSHGLIRHVDSAFGVEAGVALGRHALPAHGRGLAEEFRPQQRGGRCRAARGVRVADQFVEAALAAVLPGDGRVVRCEGRGLGREPLSLAATVTWFGRVRAYCGHADPAAAVANLVAVVVGSNGPFSPLYVIAIAGRGVLPLVALTMLSTPLFLAIPLLSRRSSLAGRLALPLVGAANTLWCIKPLGPASGVGLFLVPCVALSALLFRARERPAMLLAAVVSAAGYFIPDWAFGIPLASVPPQAMGRLAALNAASVLGLSFVLALQLAGLLQRVERAPSHR
jgi:hypothetical protein